MGCEIHRGTEDAEIGGMNANINQEGKMKDENLQILKRAIETNDEPYTMTLTAAIEIARCIPRVGRVRQGHRTVRSMALHIRQVRRWRCTYTVGQTSMCDVRTVICERLAGYLRVSTESKKLVRLEANYRNGFVPPITVVWPRQPFQQSQEIGCGYIKYHWKNHGANGTASGTVYRPSTRRFAVPAQRAIAILKQTQEAKS